MVSVQQRCGVGAAAVWCRCGIGAAAWCSPGVNTKQEKTDGAALVSLDEGQEEKSGERAPTALTCSFPRQLALHHVVTLGLGPRGPALNPAAGSLQRRGLRGWRADV